VFVEHRRDVFGIGDGSLGVGALNTADMTAHGLDERLTDLLARKDCVECLGERILGGRRTTVTDAVLIID
jgi:hypothetical protein